MNGKSFILKGSLTSNNTSQRDDYIHSSEEVWQNPQDYKSLGSVDMKPPKNASKMQDHDSRLERTIEYYQNSYLRCEQCCLRNDLNFISVKGKALCKPGLFTELHFTSPAE